MKNLFKKTVVSLLILSMSLLGISGVVTAEPIGTDTLIQLNQRGETLSRLQAQIARDDVREQFISRGVSPGEIDARIAALSTEELQLLSMKLDELPAGGNILGLIGAVFVVLLILEVLGITNVFTSV